MATAVPLLQVSFRTTPVGAFHAPLNCVAVWVEDAEGEFVKTIGRWCGIRAENLVAWENMAGPDDVDAVSGATRPDHAPTLTLEWDLKDKLGELVLDGIYTIRMELADGNSTAQAQNHQGLFTFTKGLVQEVQSNIENGGFVEVTIDYNPIALECNNNILDPGETCDPPGSCPVECDQSVASACEPNVIVGSSATCNASCAIVPITTCINGDGCCAEGCTSLDDDDCTSNEIVDGGCATGGDGHGGLLAFVLFGALAFVSRRRRR